jgi:hypothetical protein
VGVDKDDRAAKKACSPAHLGHERWRKLGLERPAPLVRIVWDADDLLDEQPRLYRASLHDACKEHGAGLFPAAEEFGHKGRVGLRREDEIIH